MGLGVLAAAGAMGGWALLSPEPSDAAFQEDLREDVRLSYQERAAGNFDAAEIAIRVAGRLGNDDVRLDVLRAWVGHGEHERARGVGQQLLERPPGALRNLAAILLSQTASTPGATLEWLKSADANDPDVALARAMARGEQLCGEGRHAEGDLALEEAQWRAKEKLEAPRALVIDGMRPGRIAVLRYGCTGDPEHLDRALEQLTERTNGPIYTAGLGAVGLELLDARISDGLLSGFLDWEEVQWNAWEADQLVHALMGGRSIDMLRPRIDQDLLAHMRVISDTSRRLDAVGSQNLRRIAKWSIRMNDAWSLADYAGRACPSESDRAYELQPPPASSAEWLADDDVEFEWLRSGVERRLEAARSPRGRAALQVRLAFLLRWRAEGTFSIAAARESLALLKSAAVNWPELAHHGLLSLAQLRIAALELHHEDAGHGGTYLSLKGLHPVEYLWRSAIAAPAFQARLRANKSLRESARLLRTSSDGPWLWAWMVGHLVGDSTAESTHRGAFSRPLEISRVQFNAVLPDELLSALLRAGPDTELNPDWKKTCSVPIWFEPSTADLDAARLILNLDREGECWLAATSVALHAGDVDAFEDATEFFEIDQWDWEGEPARDANVQALAFRLPSLIGIYAHRTQDPAAIDWLRDATRQVWWEDRPALRSKRVIGSRPMSLAARTLRNLSVEALAWVGDPALNAYLQSQSDPVGRWDAWRYAEKQSGWVMEFGLESVLRGEARERVLRREYADAVARTAEQ